MTNLFCRARRHLLAGLGLAVVATCVSGCEPGKDFWVTNATSQTVTVVSRLQLPGQAPAPTTDVFDVKLTLSPGQRQGIQIDLSRGVCKNITFLAYDASGGLVAQDPTPICEDKAGHGNTWIIKGK